MPFFNVEVNVKLHLVVQANDERQARHVADEEWEEAIRDETPDPSIHVTGEVTELKQLVNGWDGDCIPYGGDGNTRLRELLPTACEIRY